MNAPLDEIVAESAPDPSSTDLLLKILKKDGRPPLASGDFRWALPTLNDDGTWTPGAWASVKGQLEPCANGLHLCRVIDVPNWIRSAEEVYVAEASGKLLVHDDESSQSKVVVRKARLTRRLESSTNTLRTWAADCAEHVLPLYESKYPEDKRPRQAIEAARAYIRGAITLGDLQKARAAAAYAADAADATATYAAYAAAYAATYAGGAASAASAADAAAGATASRQERAWQARHLATLLGLPGYEEVAP